MQIDNLQTQNDQSAQVQEDKPIMKKISNKPLIKSNISLILGTILVILAGIATGWALSGQSLAKESAGRSADVTQEVKVSDTEAGLTDESNLPDTAEGVLVEGGIEGEGTHHLDRGTGASKYVYLTSTVIDLQSFVGKKVKVWGETLSALHAGWLMDVGKIKVID